MKKPSPALIAALLIASGVAFLCFHQAHTAPPPTPGVAGGPKQQATQQQATDTRPITAPDRIDDEAAGIFSEIGNLAVGSTISLPLPGGGRVEGRVNYAKNHRESAAAAGGVLADGSGIFEIATEPGGYRGFILPKQGGTATVYSGSDEDGPQIARRPRGEVVCEPDPNFKPLAGSTTANDPQKAAISNGGRTVGIIYEPIPLLSSLPRAAATIYLDFDGEVIEGQSWEGGARIVAPSYNLTAAEVTDMWRRVAEDYAPFEVNVTTDLQAYLRAPQGRRMRCITTTNNFASAGGVAFNNTFIESGDTCCWNFYSGNAGAVVISHEVGHTFNLAHDTTSTAGYYGGHGSGATSWGPIMGAPYNQNVCQWSKGDYPDGQEHQDDLAYIGSMAPMKTDDHASTTGQATPLTFTSSAGTVSNTGLIENPGDLDRFIFTTGGGTVSLQFAGAAPSPNLDIEAKLYNSAGTLVATASPTNNLAATLTASLAAGTYTVTVDGVGNLTWTTGGYDDWGSLGAYTISGTVPMPGWRFRVPVNALAGATVGTVAPGTGSAYAITSGNTGSAFAIHATTGAITVATPAALASVSLFDLTISYTAGGASVVAAVPITVAPLRGMKQQIWTNLSGTSISNMTSLATYPNSPNLTGYSPSTQANYRANNYGQKLSAYLLPTETGSYTFWTLSDDSSELWLSTDATSTNKVRIASNATAVGAGSWTTQASQQSVPINLVAGQRYYLEILHRNRTGADYVAVAWQTPTLARRLIPDENLEYPGTMPNRAPWLANMTFRIRENSGIGAAVGILAAGDFEAGSVLSAYTITGGNTGNTFALNPTTGALTVNAAVSFATLPKYLLDVRVADASGLTTTAQIAVEIEPLAVKRELWTGIPGTAISNLTTLTTYPDNPNSTTYQPFFETPTNASDNFGQKLSGYLRAPDSGSYTFWIASDDEGELWLSTDSNAANKSKIAYTLNATNSREWGKYAIQKSATIILEGGKSYYIEALNKEGSGGDNLAVSWSGPDFGQIILGAPNVTQQFYNHAAPVLGDKSVTVFDRDDILATLEAKDWSDPGTTISYSITAGNADGAFTIDPRTGTIRRNSTLLPTGTRVLTITAADNGVPSLSDTAAVTVQVLKAGLKREVWTDLSSSQDLSGLTGSLDFPRTPSVTGFVQNFQAPIGYGENYGQRLSGYLMPPTTGNYTFWIASDDGGELSISSDANPSNKRRIASVTGSVSSLQWNAQASQQSAVIPLVAGQAYYIEALQKEGVGGDHLAVAWQGPSIAQALIPVAYLQYPETYRPALKREVWYNNATLAPPARSADFTGTMFAFKSQLNVADGFSERITGFIVPPVTGSYTFWLASDDDGQLLLSSDEDPANLAPIASVTGFTDPEAWDVSPSQKSVPRNLAAGRRYRIEVRHRDGSFGDHVAVAWQGPGITRSIIPNDCLEPPSSPADRTLLQREVWNGVAGDNVADLTSAAVFPASPSTVGTLTADAGLVAPTNGVEAFGQRISGFLVAPEDGRYTFWIASDDSSELWLATDDNPANRVRIASVSGSVTAQAWDTQASQKSVPIALVTGRRYYLEVLHKEGTGTDHLAVAWQGPSFARRVIANGSLESPLVLPGKPSLKREIWTGLTGTAVSNLTSSSAFVAAKPVFRGALTTFESPAAFGENFGERITADLVPPESGNYKFWIAADASAELWLATDSEPANRIKIAFTTAATGVREWTRFATQESGALPLTSGQRYHIEVLHKEGTGTDHLAVAWQGPSFPRQIIDGRFLEYPGTLAPPTFLKREIWTGIGGNDVANLTSTGTYPALPNQTATLDTFETPANAADNYGQKVSGYLIAPQTGSYTFWIASDDGSELWLATNGVAANKTKIAFTTNATGVRNWTDNVNQTSAAITLTAGQRCYIEALHKEGGGDDYLAVAWQGPGFTQQIIGSQFLEYPGLPAAQTQPTTIVPATGIDPGYTFWLSATGLQGNNRLPQADPDGDGIPNSLEFTLGGIPAGTGANSIALLPEISIDPDWAIFEYRRADVALAIDPFAQFATTLGSWTRASNGVGGVRINTVEDGFGTGIDRVTVKIPRAGAPKMFLRLNSNMQ